MYAGNVKNSSLCNQQTHSRYENKTHETPTGAAESWPLELAGGDDGTVNVRSAAATVHIKKDEMSME
jgi:hypothetical protein